MIRKSIIIGVSFIICVLMIGCAYKFSGGGEFPGKITKISVNVFENRSSETGLENVITNDLIFEITRNNKVSVTNEEKAEAVLSGILTAAIDTISHSAPIERRITVSADLKLAEKNKGVIWSANGVSANETYRVNNAVETTNAEKNNAIGVLSKRLAEDVYNRLSSDF